MVYIPVTAPPDLLDGRFSNLIIAKIHLTDLQMKVGVLARKSSQPFPYHARILNLRRSYFRYRVVSHCRVHQE